MSPWEECASQAYAPDVPAEIEPPELARVVDFAERSRDGDWSLRSALVRYAQAEPERVRALLEDVRRLESALHPHTKALEERGAQLWSAVESGVTADVEDVPLVALLEAAVELDRLGDVLATWATDWRQDRPDDVVDAVTADVARRLDDLGVSREEQPPSRAPRRRGG